MADDGMRTFWVDENLRPTLAQWFSSCAGLQDEHFYELGFHETGSLNNLRAGARIIAAGSFKAGETPAPPVVQRFQTPDHDIFLQAREREAIIVTKDGDFASLISNLGPPPQVIWVGTGNLRTPELLDVFRRRLSSLTEYLDAGAPLIAVD